MTETSQTGETTPSGALTGPFAAAGPLIVSAANPRYFAVASANSANQPVVYLTGSHIWNNLQDGMGPGLNCADTPEPFNFDNYLDFLNDHGHNFIRLWRWEQFKSQAAGSAFHLCMTPQPWRRTGPGMASDGKPKYNLSLFDPAYFERLRDRVSAAGNRGIYVAVMLFDGWALHLSPAPDNVEGHPFYATNNINGIKMRSITDYQVLPLNPDIQALQAAYIRQVVDTVNALPNVLYEVANESSGGGLVDKNFAQMLGLGEPPDWGDSTQWQYWVIETLKRYEQEKGYAKHPIGMTMQFPVKDQTKVNEPLYQSAAEWISPGYDDEYFASGHHPMEPGGRQSHWYDDPPAADGVKVVISDTDHYAPGKADVLWAWKSFLRGHHPILMDFGLIGGIKPEKTPEGAPPYTAFEVTRFAMGDTLRYAQKLNLAATTPRGDLSSTGFALANPGHEYLVLQPAETGGPFTVMLEAGEYAVEWFSVDSRETKVADKLMVESVDTISFSGPFNTARPAVLYLKHIGQ